MFNCKFSHSWKEKLKLILFVIIIPFCRHVLMRCNINSNHHDPVLEELNLWMIYYEPFFPRNVTMYTCGHAVHELLLELDASFRIDHSLWLITSSIIITLLFSVRHVWLVYCANHVLLDMFGTTYFQGCISSHLHDIMYVFVIDAEHASFNSRHCVTRHAIIYYLKNK